MRSRHKTRKRIPFYFYAANCSTGTSGFFSYLNIGFFDTEAEAKSLISYVSCKFVRFLLRSTYSSVHVSKDNFRFVPLVDFKKTWTDEKLYEYYELSPEQIALIEDTMRPMVLEGGDE